MDNFQEKSQTEEEVAQGAGEVATEANQAIEQQQDHREHQDSQQRPNIDLVADIEAEKKHVEGEHHQQDEVSLGGGIRESGGSGSATEQADATAEKQVNTCVIIETIDRNSGDELADKDKKQNLTDQKKITLADKSASAGGPTLPITEEQEVTSTSNKNENSHKTGRGSRRSSYQGGRGYAGGFQNYGLTYLPYKSNFEPSEDARRRADEFFKTLKL